MNERIKELSKKSWEAVDFGKPLPIEQFEQNFAELIVRECIDYCGENLSNTVGGALKIHFGVEE